MKLPIVFSVKKCYIHYNARLFDVFIKFNMRQKAITDGNGTTHELSCRVKSFGGPEVTVDGNTYKVKSSSWLIRLVDYSVDFPGANCHIVMIGNKARLAVNGTYNDDQTPYEPVSSIPAWVWVLAGLSVIGGAFIGGAIFAAIGAAFTMLYVSAALKKNNSKAIIFFVVFIVLCAIWFVVQLALLPSMYPELYGNI